MSEKLYYKDSYIYTFTATVLNCVERESGGWLVELDRTAFFPEGGGQYADTGHIGDVAVTDVQEEDGVIWHRTTEPLEIGAIVDCTIDWNARFEKMQCHTGEHIISGIVHALYGYDNVGFHLGDDYVTLDFNGMLSRSQLDEIEDIAAAVIVSNVPVETSFPEPEELANMEYRSKLELTENVRIVTIPGVDVCACCAPHVHCTGEVGMVKILDAVKHKNGVRLNMTAGMRLLRDYRSRYEQTAAVSGMLAVPQDSISQGVQRLKEECSSLQYRLKGARTALALTELDKLPQGSTNIALFVADWEYDVMIAVADRGKSLCPGLFGIFSGEQGQFKYVISSQSQDLRARLREINGAIGGKGGGSTDLIQGRATADRETIQQWFDDRQQG